MSLRGGWLEYLYWKNISKNEYPNVEQINQLHNSYKTTLRLATEKMQAYLSGYYLLIWETRSAAKIFPIVFY